MPAHRTSVAQIRQAGKTYQTGDTTIVALAPSNLGVYAQELLLIVGPSGSGKTTLFSLLGCVRKRAALCPAKPWTPKPLASKRSATTCRRCTICWWRVSITPAQPGRWGNKEVT